MGVPPVLGSSSEISRPANSQTPIASSATPTTTVANGRYRCADAINGETANPKIANTVRNPVAITTVATAARTSATGREVSRLAAITKPR
nr:hypothetical protein CPGR_05073 [Mycolicibacter nonchromogenicus]